MNTTLEKKQQQKNEMIMFTLFGELRKKRPKNAQISLKLSKSAVFRLLVNE